VSQKDLLLLFHLLGKSRKKLWRYLKDPGQLDKQLRISQSKFSEAKEATALALESAKKLGFRILNPLERAFPESLKCIPDPPAFLFVRGDVSCLSEKKAVALIGTRKPTDYGREQAYRYGQLLAQKGWLIVSGLARGCDTAAHQGCLRASGRTLAFLAHGLHMIYPPENKTLARDIVKHHGCLVSEYLPGTPPLPEFFKERDRLQSALSRGVFFIEAEIESGTMHTVRYGLRYRKVLACLKHPTKYAKHPITAANRLYASRKNVWKIQDENSLKHFVAAMNNGSHSPKKKGA